MDARGGRAIVGAARLENGQSLIARKIKKDRAGHTQANGHLEQLWGPEGKDWKDLA